MYGTVSLVKVIIVVVNEFVLTVNLFIVISINLLNDVNCLSYNILVTSISPHDYILLYFVICVDSTNIEIMNKIQCNLISLYGPL